MLDPNVLVYGAAFSRSLDVQRTSVLVFCSSFVPMMLVTIAACFHNSRFTQISSPLWFVVVVLVSGKSEFPREMMLRCIQRLSL